jgi:hypothetical protein
MFESNPIAFQYMVSITHPFFYSYRREKREDGFRQHFPKELNGQKSIRMNERKRIEYIGMNCKTGQKSWH